MLIRSSLLSKIAGIDHGFLSPQLNPPEGFLRSHQVHGKTVTEACNESFSQFPTIQADGLITNTGRAVAVQTADCLPVLFSSLDGKLVAAVHAGWRGLHKGILIEAVKHFQSKGYAPNSLFIALGPAIGPCCFEVNREVHDTFQKDWGHLWTAGPSPLLNAQPQSMNAARTTAKPSQNNLWINLDLIARLHLTSEGVPDFQIEDVGFCTYCGPGDLASFRRATHEGFKAGRQWSFIQTARTH